MRRLPARIIGALLAGCSSASGPSIPGSGVPVPTLAATVPIPPQYGIHDTFIRDGYLFISAWNTGLVIMDVGNGGQGGSPAHPVEVSRIVPSDDGVPGGPAIHTAWWFHNPVTGERRYVFVDQEGPSVPPLASTGDIHAIDVQDLAHPREVAFFHLEVDPPAGSHNFWMDETAQRLFIAYYNGGVVALDVSGVLSGDLAPREIARIKPTPNSYIWGIQGFGGFIYVTDLLEGVYQLRFDGGVLGVAGGGGNVPERYSTDLCVNGSYAYSGTWGGTGRNGVFGNAIKIWRLGASGAPTIADSILMDGVTSINDVKLSSDGRMLAVSADKGIGAGLYLYSLADPARPLLVGQAPIAAGVHTARFAEIGGRWYVFAAKNPGSDATPALLIYDVTAMKR